MFHQRSRCVFAQKRNVWALQCSGSTSMFVEHLHKIDISLARLIARRACFVIVMSSLLPPIRRNVQHCDRTSHGNSFLCSLSMFRIRSCILFRGMHSSSRSRTWLTTRILGLNHGWNSTLIISNFENHTDPFWGTCATKLQGRRKDGHILISIYWFSRGGSHFHPGN